MWARPRGEGREALSCSTLGRAGPNPEIVKGETRELKKGMFKKEGKGGEKRERNGLSSRAEVLEGQRPRLRHRRGCGAAHGGGADVCRCRTRGRCGLGLQACDAPDGAVSPQASGVPVSLQSTPVAAGRTAPRSAILSTSPLLRRSSSEAAAGPPWPWPRRCGATPWASAAVHLQPVVLIQAQLQEARRRWRGH